MARQGRGFDPRTDHLHILLLVASGTEPLFVVYMTISNFW